MTFNEGDGLKTVSMHMCGSMLCLPIHYVSGKKQTIKHQPTTNILWRGRAKHYNILMLQLQFNIYGVFYNVQVTAILGYVISRIVELAI